MCFFFSTLVRCGEYRSQTGIQRKLNFVSVRTIKGSSSPSSVVTLALSPTYFAFYGTSFFPTPTRVSSARGTRLAPFPQTREIHAESRPHVRRKPRHVPIPPVIPSGEHGLFHTNTPPRWEWLRFHPHDHLQRNPITRPKLFPRPPH